MVSLFVLHSLTSLVCCTSIGNCRLWPFLSLRLQWSGHAEAAHGEAQVSCCPTFDRNVNVSRRTVWFTAPRWLGKYPPQKLHNLFFLLILIAASFTRKKSQPGWPSTEAIRLCRKMGCVSIKVVDIVDIQIILWLKLLPFSGIVHQSSCWSLVKLSTLIKGGFMHFGRWRPWTYPKRTATTTSEILF